MLFCPNVDGENDHGGMPKPVTGSHPTGDLDADPPCTDVMNGGEFVKTGPN